MKKIFLKIIKILFPVTCSVCKINIDYKKRVRICDKCNDLLEKNNGLFCKKCALPLKDGGEHCYICRKDKYYYKFNIMRSAYIYKGIIRDLILKFKYSNRMFLTYDFANEMSSLIKENKCFSNYDYIIPVPINITRKIKRGYNQAELLADNIAGNLNKPVLKNVLYRKKITKPQFKLSKKSRAENIKGSFLIKNNKSIYKKNILLIDDIATTGLTVSECAKVLKEAGAKKVFVATLARD